MESKQQSSCAGNRPGKQHTRCSTTNFLVAKARTDEERAAVRLAMEVLARDYGERLSLISPAACRDYLRLRLAGREHEVFVCIFLDAQPRVIEVEDLFRGTLSQTSVYPREVVKRALQLNAAAVIFAHNHPSGVMLLSMGEKYANRRRAAQKTLATKSSKVLQPEATSRRRQEPAQ